MKKLIILVAMIVAGCCETHKVDIRVVEKMTTQNRDGSLIYYHLLLSDGTDMRVNSLDYVKAKPGDVWTVNKCKDE